MKKIAINGFGRIGRLVFRSIMSRTDMEVVAINDITDAPTLAYLLKYDSVHGVYKKDVRAEDGYLVVEGKKVKILAERDPAKLPWGEMGIDLVVESTGIFRSRDKAALHLTAGAKKVIISAPSKGEVDATIVMGVNDDQLKAEHQVVSNASCTTNCLAPVMKVMVDNFTVESAVMTTIHSYTNDQKILDLPHSDLRRARAAAVSMIPTTTGAAVATAKVIPVLKGKIDGMAVRVPTPDGSLVDVNVTVAQDVTPEMVNNLMKKAAEGPMKGILGYTDQPVVSVDIVGDSHSSMFDSLSTMVVGKTVKLLSWYDNEWGYSCRVVDLAAKMLSF